MYFLKFFNNPLTPSRTNLSISLSQWVVLETNPEDHSESGTKHSLLGKKDGYQPQEDYFANSLEAALTSYLLPDVGRMAAVDW